MPTKKQTKKRVVKRKTRKNETEQQRIVRQKKEFLKYYKDLPLITLASASIGKDVTTVFRWRKSDAKFAMQMEVAKARWAMKNVKGVRSKEWLLERIMRGEFSQKNIIELAGELKLTDAERKEVEDVLEREAEVDDKIRES